MKANRTYTRPPVIEDLGDGTYYYNFWIVETTVIPEGDEESYANFDYEQVRCHYPVDEIEIQTNVDAEGYDHIINLDVQQ